MTTMRRKVLQTIADFIAQHGFAPSTRELGDLVGFKSSQTAHYHTLELIREGYLTHQAAKQRTLCLTVLGMEALGYGTACPMCGQSTHGKPSTLRPGAPGTTKTAESTR